jgi:hypothetical protein
MIDTIKMLQDFTTKDLVGLLFIVSVLLNFGIASIAIIAARAWLRMIMRRYEEIELRINERLDMLEYQIDNIVYKQTAPQSTQLPKRSIGRT